MGSRKVGFHLYFPAAASVIARRNVSSYKTRRVLSSGDEILNCSYYAKPPIVDR